MTPTNPSPSDLAFISRCGGAGIDTLHMEKLNLSPPSDSPPGAVQIGLGDLPDGFIVVLLGARGLGKTQIACNLVATSIKARLRLTFDRKTFKGQPRYTTAAKIFRAMRDAQKRGREDETLNETDMVGTFVNPSLLVIDDAHERAETDFENRTLTEIIDDRYGAKRSTILISNLNRAEFSKCIGPSIVSRIHECGRVIECNWLSFREVK